MNVNLRFAIELFTVLWVCVCVFILQLHAKSHIVLAQCRVVTNFFSSSFFVSFNCCVYFHSQLLQIQIIVMRTREKQIEIEMNSPLHYLDRRCNLHDFCLSVVHDEECVFSITYMWWWTEWTENRMHEKISKSATWCGCVSFSRCKAHLTYRVCVCSMTYQTAIVASSLIIRTLN